MRPTRKSTRETKGHLFEWPFLLRVQDRVTLPVRRRRRIAAVLLLRRAKELVLCVERIAANGVAPAAA